MERQSSILTNEARSGEYAREASSTGPNPYHPKRVLKMKPKKPTTPAMQRALALTTPVRFDDNATNKARAAIEKRESYVARPGSGEAFPTLSSEARYLALAYKVRR